jgi:protein involved in polysaccharide export with SLBB domain
MRPLSPDPNTAIPPRVGYGLRVALLAMLASALGGCASQTPAPAPDSKSSSTALQVPVAQSDAALDNLWRERLTEQKDLPIGPGDVLEISVPNVKELDNRTERVDGKGDITLPLIGSLHVAGHTEPEIIVLITDALHKYVYHPEVNLLVKTYSSRVVGVMGSVRAPGLYVLNGPNDTVRDLIQRAGGLADNGAHEVLLSPAHPGSNSDLLLKQQDANEAALTKPPPVPESAHGGVNNFHAQPSGVVTNTALEGGYTPWLQPPEESDFDSSLAYVIPLGGDSPYRKYVNLPVRPGDTLFVPPAGQVSVIGWVYKPVVVPVTQGLTTLGAVSAAGGMLYAADQTAVKIMRREPGDQTKVIEVNLEEVKKGNATDVALQANDVVDVGYSAAKIPGYALYYAAQGIVSFAPAALLMGGL